MCSRQARNTYQSSVDWGCIHGGEAGWKDQVMGRSVRSLPAGEKDGCLMLLIFR